jgi:hypothetical protein
MSSSIWLKKEQEKAELEAEGIRLKKEQAELEAEGTRLKNEEEKIRNEQAEDRRALRLLEAELETLYLLPLILLFLVLSLTLYLLPLILLFLVLSLTLYLLPLNLFFLVLPYLKVSVTGCHSDKCDDSGASFVSNLKESLQTKGIPTEVEGHKGYVGMNDEGVLMEGVRRGWFLGLWQFVVGCCLPWWHRHLCL